MTTKTEHRDHKRRRADRSPQGERADPAFAWATDPRLACWREALRDWTVQHTNRRGAIEIGNAILDRVGAMGDPVPSVSTYCQRTFVCATPLHASRRKGNGGIAFSRTVHAFFEWYLDNRLSTIDPQGRPVRSPDHWNPVPKLPSRATPTESARAALPSRLIRQLLDRLTADDWKWAKTLAEDWVLATDTTTGRTTRVWCPVRAAVLALKLLLPLRTFQIRMLESGEGDAERCVDGKWIANTGPHAPPSGRRRTERRGFLRAFRDRLTGGTCTGFFVNTNKTSDRVPDQAETGYEIPWQHDRAIEIVEAVERWQERYNPVDVPLSWTQIHEPKIRLATHARPGAAFFLMRDPNGTYRNEPITAGRVGGIWNLLMGACEDDLTSRGERLPDGQPIRLTKTLIQLRRKANGGRSTQVHVREAVYDLHSLRVSLLTALAIEGGVPLHVLSKCVAGHASLVMTLYYLKTDPGTVNRSMKEAEAKIDAGSQEAFLRYLQSQTRSSDGYVADPAAIAALDGHSPVGWQMLETGICPVGGARCSDGGPPIGKNRFGPVPGGRNCVRCRFHISGPAFLPGIVARFNACSMRVERAREQVKASRRLLMEREDAQFAAEQQGHPGDPAALIRARDRHEEATAALDSEVGTLQELATLAERCLRILRTSDGQRPSLILRSEKKVLDIEIRKTCSFALYDAVCQASTLYPDEVVPEAQARRAAALDRMLIRNGRAPMMCLLPDDQGLKLANELTQLMALQLGSERAFEIITDERACLEADAAAIVDEMLAKASQPLALAKPS